ncbi:hypothetical protein PMAYCL1PPCAC_24814, partial [Pristionchus mayeri]
MLRPEEATPECINMTLQNVRCDRLFVSVISDLPLEPTLSFLYAAASQFAPHLDLRVLINKFPPSDSFAFKGRYDGDIWEEKRQGEGRFKKTVSAGCFDRLHNGHKTLRCLIQPAIVRVNAVRDFLESITDVPIEVRIITLPFMPALTMRDIQAMVVSEESKRQGQQFNTMRVYRNLDPLYIEVVEPLSMDSGRKISSTNRRWELLGNLLRPTNK